MNYKVKPITVAVGAVMTACLAGAAFADTEEDPFALEAAGDGYDLLADAHGAEGECGEGKCGEGKCGEGGDDSGEEGGDEESGDEGGEEDTAEEAPADE